jgi:hypothetical protein
VRKAGNLTTILCRGNLNFLEPSGPLQACNGTALPLPFSKTSLRFMHIPALLCLRTFMRTNELPSASASGEGYTIFMLSCVPQSHNLTVYTGSSRSCLCANYTYVKCEIHQRCTAHTSCYLTEVLFGSNISQEPNSFWSPGVTEINL